MTKFGRLFSGFKTASKGFGSRWSQAINEAGQAGKKVGKFIKPIAEGVNFATGLINTPIGQAALYGVGSLFGPAGLAAASGISTASKALYLATSLGLGVDNVVGGMKALGQGDYITGTARTALGLAGAGKAVSSLGKIRVEGLTEGAKSLAIKQGFVDRPLGTRVSSMFTRQPTTGFNELRPYDMSRYYNRPAPTRLGMLRQGGVALASSLGRNVRERFGAIGERARMVGSSLASVEAPSAIMAGAEQLQGYHEIV